jgi:hypothetical protein
MALSIFEDKSAQPGDAEIREALGRAATHWYNLVEYALKTYTPTSLEWKFPGAKYGWSLRVNDLRKRRVLIYMTPQKGGFITGFMFGDKAVELARQSALPSGIVEELLAARRYVEGRGIRVSVRNAADVKVVKLLMEIKMKG